MNRSRQLCWGGIPRPSLSSIYKLRKRVVTRETVVCHVTKGLIIAYETQVNRSKMRGKSMICVFYYFLEYLKKMCLN